MTFITAFTAGLRYALPDLPAVVTRTLDATFLNTVANHPEVRPWLGGDGLLNLAPVIQNPDNITVTTAHGGFIAVAIGAGRYEIHSMFLPEGRGPDVRRAMTAGLDYMFGSTDAEELVTKVPMGNPAAAGLTRRAGFESRFTSRVPWTTEPVEAEFFSLTLERWALQADVTLHLGEWFHRVIADALAASGSTLPPHSVESDVHHRMAGAAILMCRAGNARKAVQVYNTWARFACYPVIRCLREQPIILDLGDVVVEARAHEMEVLQCQ